MTNRNRDLSPGVYSGEDEDCCPCSAEGGLCAACRDAYETERGEYLAGLAAEGEDLFPY